MDKTQVDKTQLANLVSAWKEAKNSETLFRSQRTEIGNQIAALVLPNETAKGSKTVDLDDETKLTVSRGYNITIDAELMEQIAVDNGLEEHLEELFSWKPTIKQAAWDSCDEDARAKLSEAITKKPAAPQIAIKEKK